LLGEVQDGILGFVQTPREMDLLRCPSCLRRFLVGDGDAPGYACPACESSLQLMVRSIPGPPSRAAAALGAKILDSGAELERAVPASPQKSL
jgi:hypothetical protein